METWRETRASAGPAEGAGDATPRRDSLPVFWALMLLGTTIAAIAVDNAATPVFARVAELVVLVLLTLGLADQVRTHRYRTAPYWAAVLTVAVAGQWAASEIVDQGGVPSWVLALACAVALGAIAHLPRLRQGSPELHPTRRTPVPAAYWAGLGVAFGLGWASARWVSASVHLGGSARALMLLCAIALVAVARVSLGLSSATAFWMAAAALIPVLDAVRDSAAGLHPSQLLNRSDLIAVLAVMGTLAIGTVAGVALRSGAHAPPHGHDRKRSV